GDNLKALQHLASTADVTTLKAPTLTILAMTLAERKQNPMAVGLLNRAWQVYPRDFWVNTILGICLFNSRPARYREGMRYFMIAAALRKDHNAGALAYLGLAHLRNNELSQAAHVFQEAVRREPNSPDVHTNLGVILDQQAQALNLPEKFDQAIAEFRRAIE